MAERAEGLIDVGDLYEHVAVGGRIGIGDGVMEDGNFHAGRNRRAFDRLASSTRGAALSTIQRINSTYDIPILLARMGKSECSGCSPASGLTSMKLGRPAASHRRSTRPPSRQLRTRHASRANCSAKRT